MRFDLSDLKLFLHVLEAGSITAGGNRAHLSLASASARLKNMEDALGVALLLRDRRGVQPTPAGIALGHHARCVMQQIECMRGELGEYARGLKGHVRLLCNTAALSEFLPQALARFLAAQPNIDIDLEERLSHEIVPAVLDGSADLGIISDAADPAGLQLYPFHGDRLVVVTGKDHPLAGLRRVAFADTLAHDFVGLAGDAALNAYLAGHAAQAGRRLRYRVRLRSFDAICRMAESGVGIAIVPETSARRCRRAMAIRCVPLSDAWAMRRLLLCVRDANALPAHARQLLDHLRADGPGKAG